MKLKEIIKPRNFVAKNAPTAGAGRHEAKRGKYAKRAKQKQEFHQQLKGADTNA